MRKIMFFLFLVVSVAWADTGCRLGGRLKIMFVDSTIWWRDADSFWGVYQGEKLGYLLEDGYNCDKQESEKSFLDSNTYIYRSRESHGVRKVGLVQNSLSFWNMADVFKDEFMHWYQCGMLNLSYKEADSLASFLAEKLENDWDCYESEQFYVCDDPTQIPDQIWQWTENACREAGTSFLNVFAQLAKYSDIGIVSVNSQVQIPAGLRGEKYYVFDMNGKMIQSGIARNTSRLSMMPAILKIGKVKPILLK